MKKTQDPVVVEFIDRQGDYWEVVPIRRSPGRVLRLLQETIAAAENSRSFRAYSLTAEVTGSTFILGFDCGEFVRAEWFPSLLALSLGWEESHGVLIGRTSRYKNHEA